MLFNMEEKNKFFGLILKSIDHESKTPLNLIINMTDSVYNKRTEDKENMKTQIENLDKILEDETCLQSDAHKNDIINVRTYLEDELEFYTDKQKSIKQVLDNSKI